MTQRVKYNFDCIPVQSSTPIINLGEILMFHVMQQLKKLHVRKKTFSEV